MDFEEMMPIIIPVAVWIGIRIIAGTNTIIGRIFRWFWNLSFSIAAHVPFCGWMSRFIIAKTEEEKAYKEDIVRTGDENDDITLKQLEEKARREREKENERQELRDEINYRLGRNDVQIHGNIVRIGKKDYTVDEVKRELGL